MLHEIAAPLHHDLQPPSVDPVTNVDKPGRGDAGGGEEGGDAGQKQLYLLLRTGRVRGLAVGRRAESHSIVRSKPSDAVAPVVITRKRPAGFYIITEEIEASNFSLSYGGYHY